MLIFSIINSSFFYLRAFLIFAAANFSQISAACPNDAEEWQSLCYFFAANASAFVNAEENCIQIGGHLASVHNGFTNAFLAQQASLNFQTISDFWIGGSDLMIEGNFSWTDGTPFDFTEGKIQKNATGEDCISLNVSNGSWLTTDCFKSKPYVCGLSQSTTMNPSTTTTTTVKSTTTTTPPECLKDWTYYESTNSCYKDMGKANWEDAENTCKSVGAHLVSIHNYPENFFLQSFEISDGHWFWIGLHSDNGGKDWSWTDFSPLNYMDWSSKNPSCCIQCANFGNSKLESSWYNDTPCDSVQPFICKKPAYT